MEGRSQTQCQSQSQSQRVLLIHDASSGVRIKAVNWVLDGFLLKAGDIFTFLSVIHQIHHPMGYKIRVDSSMFGGANQKAINDEVARKKKEYEDNLELVKITKLYKMKEVDFKIELVAGPIPKTAAVEASKKFDATWVILDRRMKRDRNYFLEKLSCGISRMKRNDEIIQIRGPGISRAGNLKLSYGEMLQVDNKFPTRESQNDEDLFSLEFDSSCTSSTSTSTSISEAMLTLGINQDDKIKQLSTLQEAFGEDQENSSRETNGKEVHTPPMPKEIIQLDQKKCTTCDTTRPTRVWQSRKFSYSELGDATNRFSSQHLIYRSENEAVFHGTLTGSKLDVIVKEQKDVKKFKSEMQALEKTRNENVIMLLGACLENSTRLLVFEYACNGSLDQHLSHQYTKPLTWEERIKIAAGTSRGLHHLHENNIIHGDIRPKNILLTHDYEPLISGFGLARMQNDSQKSSDHYIIGTFGYLAPEYTERGKATTKTDVYAFGVVLLELLSGRTPGQNLIKWSIPLIKERKFSELIDPGIAYDNNQLMSMVQVAGYCLCKDPKLRISMDEAAFTLDYIKDEKEIQPGNEIEEVNANIENIGQSQRVIEEKVNVFFGGMTPLPKQAKHFYQVAQT